MARVARKRMHHRFVKPSHIALKHGFLFQGSGIARTKDLDQIHEDLKQPEKVKPTELDPDLPGLGQHYCMHCARHFTSDAALQAHFLTKLHKKRLKLLKEQPFTQAEAEAAVGLGTDNGKRSERSEMETS
ncbi:Bud site selection protein 20 [Phlyctochytrium bullatum]|nr:Bud site selection protein 20 [Phlyctochytrium bullatum]